MVTTRSGARPNPRQTTRRGGQASTPGRRRAEVAAEFAPQRAVLALPVSPSPAHPEVEEIPQGRAPGSSAPQRQTEESEGQAFRVEGRRHRQEEQQEQQAADQQVREPDLTGVQGEQRRETEDPAQAEASPNPVPEDLLTEEELEDLEFGEVPGVPQQTETETAQG